MTANYLRIESAKQITTITLHRPEAENSLNGEMMDELRAELERLRTDPAIRAVILTGAGRVFSAGADLKMLTRLAESNAPEQTRDEIGKWRATFEALETLPQITIAAINGLALGGGVLLALACDFRLASSRAIFGFPEIKLGIVLALGGMNRLTRLVGVSASKELLLRGRNLTAMEAQRKGLVNRVSDPGGLMSLAHSWAEHAIALSPRAVARTKNLIQDSFERDAMAYAETETAALVDLLHSKDFLDRVKAMKEKGEI